MNSRSSVNETNLVNYSADLSTLNPLDTKDGLLSFPFDHIYACHSQSTDRRQTLQLEKEVEVSTHCVVGEGKSPNSSTDISRLSEQLAVAENQNKRLKDLLIFHLDLIQQQNELITKRDKLFQGLKQENDTLKAELFRKDRRLGLPTSRPSAVSSLTSPAATTTSADFKSEPIAAQVILNSFTELLLPTSVFEENHTFPNETFGIARVMPVEPDPETPVFTAPEKPETSNKKPSGNAYKMIERKRSYVKKDVTSTETRSESLYTVTSHGGNPVIHRIQRKRRNSPGVGSLSRMTKTSKPATETSKGKGSLSGRFQLIDRPVGEDPYQLGEADLREQSPIPKLMLQKTNHGQMKVCSDGMNTSNFGSSKRVYDAPRTKAPKVSRFVSVYADVKKEPEKTPIVEEPDLSIVKTEPEIDWRAYSQAKAAAEGAYECAYTDNTTHLASILPNLNENEIQELFSSQGARLDIEDINQLEPYPIEKIAPDKTKRRAARTTSLIGPAEEEPAETKRGGESRRGRKRAFSATGLGKQTQKAQMIKPKPVKGKGVPRGKKSPVPGLMTKKPYLTLVGDPDLSWYSGLDHDIKPEDIDPLADSQIDTVEVPRWREKIYTSCYTLEGTENLDDRVFEKRHQKLEAEERRQLRWHMRRIREQRHVERLRLRQRDSWCNSAVNTPTVFTIWPRPQRDVQSIEITDTLPVTALGVALPELPKTDFMLPWVRTSKAQKRSKRSKTLH